jgi:hypothetical protein
MDAVSFNQRISATPDTLINLVGDEAVLLNLKSETYFGLDPMGTRMWAALTGAASVQEAFETLLAEYDVSVEVLRKDLTDLLEKLASHGLIEMQHV